MKRTNPILLLFLFTIFVENTGCKKEPAQTNNSGSTGGAGGSGGSGNKPPIAKAGNDTTITLPANSVKLNGSGSYDPDNDHITYKWTKTQGPNTYTIVNPDSSITNVTNLVQGTYEFVLTIKDSKGAVGIDLITVNVSPSQSSQSGYLAVYIDPGDTLVELSAQSIPFVASGLILYPGGHRSTVITNVEWSRAAGPASFNFQSTNNLSTQVSGLSTGMYVFKCKLTDTAGIMGNGYTVVSVSDPTKPEQELIIPGTWDGNTGGAWIAANLNQLPPGRGIKKVFVKQSCDSVFREASHWRNVTPGSRFAFNLSYDNFQINLFLYSDLNLICWPSSGIDTPDIKIIF